MVSVSTALGRCCLPALACWALLGCGSTDRVDGVSAFDAGGAAMTGGETAGASATADDGGPRPAQSSDLGQSPAPRGESEVLGVGRGCSATAPRFDGARSVMVAGKQREYLVQLPAGYDPMRRYPLLFGLHGAGGNGPSYAGSFPLRAAWQEKAILVFPSALFYPVDGRTTWRFPTDENLAFFDAMVAELDAGLCVDRARVFASGFSSGGFFSNTLGCRRGDTVRAIVPVAGGDRDFNELCVGHVAVLVISSPLDTSDPTGGPPGISHHERGLRALDYFRERNGCSDATEPLAAEGCVQYRDCQAGAPVLYCEHQSGHAWPSALHAPAAEFLAQH